MPQYKESGSSDPLSSKKVTPLTLGQQGVIRPLLLSGKGFGGCHQSLDLAAFQVQRQPFQTGGETFKLLGNFYIGYSVSFVGSLIGLVWGLVEGLICGFVFAKIYNLFCKE